MAIDQEAPLRFLATAFHPDDWIAVLLKSHETGQALQRVGPLSMVAGLRFQAWLRFQNARRFSVYVSVNPVEPKQRSRTRESIAAIRHVFLDADSDGDRVLASIGERPDLPTPSYVVSSSPGRLHVLWRVEGFRADGAEMLQKQLARDLRTDPAATSCAQLTRLPGFLNHKYRPAPLVRVLRHEVATRSSPQDFPRADSPQPVAAPSMRASEHRSVADPLSRARSYLRALPAAVTGRAGDALTFRVCCRLSRGFDLNDAQALEVIADWNHRCEPPWSERELREKLRNARLYGREPVGILRGSLDSS